MTLNRSQFCASSIMFLMVILKDAALQKEGQLNYINSLTIKISPDFTIDDIHAIRYYNYEVTKDCLCRIELDIIMTPLLEKRLKSVI